MRSDWEIRREVEMRLRRRGLLILDGGLWLLVGFGLFEFTQYRSLPFSEPWPTLIIVFMLIWLVLVGLHGAGVAYVEVREWMVKRAIEREREFYVLQNAYEKRKHNEPSSRSVDEARRLAADDGELITFPYHEAEDNQYAQRSRNS